jgi:hypothetical protein
MAADTAIFILRRRCAGLGLTARWQSLLVYTNVASRV